MKIGISEQIALCCNLAEQAIENDGWAVDYIYNEDGEESYSEGTQERYSQYYSVFWEQLNNAKN